MVELLRRVVAAISVREGWVARLTAPTTIARLRRLRSSCRTPTVMSRRPPAPFRPFPLLPQRRRAINATLAILT